MYNPLVSIVIPVYNGSNYLAEAIDSAISQTYKNIEIIVVNDGSTDNGQTRSIALSYGDKIVYYEKENGGCASALNYGISKMKGEYFSWLSHDDRYYPDKVNEQIACIRNHDLDHQLTIVSCNARLIDENRKTFYHPEQKDAGLYSGPDFLNRLLNGVALNGCGLLIPKHVIDQTGFFSTNLKFILDYEYWLRTVLVGASLFRMGSAALVENRVHGSQVTVKQEELYNLELENTISGLAEKFIESKNIDYIKLLYAYSIKKRLKKVRILLSESLKASKDKMFCFYCHAYLSQIKEVVLSWCKRLYWSIIRHK